MWVRIGAREPILTHIDPRSPGPEKSGHGETYDDDMAALGLRRLA